MLITIIIIYHHLLTFGQHHIDSLYPVVYELIKIIATLPVTVASCERTHSKVKIINSYLRASMSDDRLESLVTISVERDIADRLDLDELVNLFKTGAANEGEEGMNRRKLPL